MQNYSYNVVNDNRVLQHAKIGPFCLQFQNIPLEWYKCLAI